jgi:hypothetical protein
VFAVPLDVMGSLAHKLTEVYERQSGKRLVGRLPNGLSSSRGT